MFYSCSTRITCQIAGPVPNAWNHVAELEVSLETLGRVKSDHLLGWPTNHAPKAPATTSNLPNTGSQKSQRGHLLFLQTQLIPSSSDRHQFLLLDSTFVRILLMCRNSSLFGKTIQCPPHTETGRKGISSKTENRWCSFLWRGGLSRTRDLSGWFCLPSHAPKGPYQT